MKMWAPSGYIRNRSREADVSFYGIVETLMQFSGRQWGGNETS